MTSSVAQSKEPSPTALFTSGKSSNNQGIFNPGEALRRQSNQNPTWPGQFDFSSSAWSDLGMSPSPSVHQPGSSVSTEKMTSVLPHRQNSTTSPAVLSVGPIAQKSRVETQIGVKLTLYPMPPGVTKLHLPTHTISKPKLLAKPSSQKTPDTLELYTMLVCTSAMKDPEKAKRAYQRAASADQPVVKIEGRRSSTGDIQGDDDDPNKPLNGGEVHICPGCITRERKRAARKKVKKADEEEAWAQDESKRAIVFNTTEIKEWQPPDQTSWKAGDNPSEDVRKTPPPEGAMQVHAPMRIACYCRHHGEKLGFQ